MVAILRHAAVWLVIAAGSSGLPSDCAAADGLHPLERYEGGSKPVEDLFVGSLSGFFGRPVSPGEPVWRGTHAVGTCTAATFEVHDIEADPDVPDRLALGVFAEPRTFDARVRFSNGLGAPLDPSEGFDDKDYDARALAVQINYDEDRRQDFVLQNSPIFPIWPVEGFALTVRFSIAKAKGQAKEFMAQLTSHQRATLLNVLDKVRHYPRYPQVVLPTFAPEPDAYRLEIYWSGKAHQHGMRGLPVKYIARPCNGNGIYVPAKGTDFAVRSNDFMQSELKRHIDHPLEGEARACFDFYVQPLKAEAMTGPDGRILPEAEHWRWIEDTTLEWKESEAPAYRVGRIALTGPVLGREICDHPDNFINSSINTLPEHEGLGRISRAEKVAARASIERRRRAWTE